MHKNFQGCRCCFLEKIGQTQDRLGHKVTRHCPARTFFLLLFSSSFLESPPTSPSNAEILFRPSNACLPWKCHLYLLCPRPLFLVFWFFLVFWLFLVSWLLLLRVFTSLGLSAIIKRFQSLNTASKRFSFCQTDKDVLLHL